MAFPDTHRPIFSLTVFCRSDFPRDGAANSQDFFDFLSAFFGGG
jgi:hypothetical protein